MGTARRGFDAAMAGGKVYVMGGYGNDDYVSSVECFDPVTGAWEVVAPMGTARVYSRGVSA